VHHTRSNWGERHAEAIVQAAQASLRLWGEDGTDFEALPADIALEAELALDLDRQIDAIEERIWDDYCEADPEQMLTSPGVL
jgi:hypothetical protein